MAAELVDPLAKSIYKGKDAFAEYGSGEYWKGVGKAGLTGAAVSGVYGGAFDVMAGGVKAGDINAAKADINATVMQSENLKEKNRFTEDRAKRADSQTLGNLKIIEKTLKSVDKGKRAELIKKNGLSGMFGADGSLNADIENSLTNGSGLDRRYYSENQRGLEKNIDEDNVYRWNYFYTPVQIGEEFVGVRIAVRDIAQSQDHQAESQIYNWA